MSGHWYDKDGNLYGQVPMVSKPGKLRDFTLADARKVAALPSVTTILGLLSKPSLNRWSVEQGIKATLDHVLLDPLEVGQRLVLDPKGLVSQLFYKSEEYRDWTATFGSAVHWWLNKKLRSVETTEIPPMIPGAEEIADGVQTWMSANGYDLSHTEHRFARTDLGYAGTVDLIGTHYGSPCIIDLKTQEQPLVTYPEYALQLAGYDYALDSAWSVPEDDYIPAGVPYIFHGVPVHRERISLIANRLQPGDIKQHLWVDKGSTVEATNQRYDAIWIGLTNLWFQLNSYDPRSKDAA